MSAIDDFFKYKKSTKTVDIICRDEISGFPVKNVIVSSMNNFNKCHMVDVSNDKSV